CAYSRRPKSQDSGPHRQTCRQAAVQVRRSEAEIGPDQERSRSQDQSASEESRTLAGRNESHPGSARHSNPEGLRANGGQAEAPGGRTTEAGGRTAGEVEP